MSYLKSLGKYVLPIVVCLGVGYFFVHGGVSFSAGCDQSSCAFKSGVMVEVPNPLAPKVVVVPSF